MDEKEKDAYAENPDSAENKEEETSEDTKGLDYLIKLSYSCADRSDLSYREKRNLLFSLYSYRCLFDLKELKRLSKTLVKYGCSFYTADDTVKNFEHVYSVTDKSGNVLYKFDAGSPLWAHKVKTGEISGENAALPEKLTLYEMPYACVSLNTATAELKAMWFVYFPYVFLMGAPVEHDLYDSLKAVIHTPEVFSAANNARYADNICCTTAELNGEDPFVADWYRPFVEWKCEKNEKGISRETA